MNSDDLTVPILDPAQLAELRTDLARLRGQIAGRTAEPDTGLATDSGSGRGTGGRRARPRAAQRRPGPTATTTETAPADETRPVAPDAQE